MADGRPLVRSAVAAAGSNVDVLGAVAANVSASALETASVQDVGEALDEATAFVGALCGGTAPVAPG